MFIFSDCASARIVVLGSLAYNVASQFERGLAMLQRGRRSAAAAVLPIKAVNRPEPPKHLTPAEAAVWLATVDGMRADWFLGPSSPLLEAYCGAVVMARSLRAELRKLSVEDKQFGPLAAAHAREIKTMSSLATRLRLTPQSNRQSTRDGRVATWGPKPWDRF
jgi:phage terminase small subunit